MKKDSCENVIDELDNEFDTHKFIENFILKYEKEYVELLCSDINKNGIFRTTHSKIGRYLSINSSSLKIEKINKVDSENIKKYDSENQNWRKTI